MKTRTLTTKTSKLAGATLVAAICLWAVGQATSAVAAGASRVADAIWAHDQLYATVPTPTAFKSPPAHSTDVIYSFAGSGLAGQRSVAESAPGDRDYNGGRWTVKAVTFTELGLLIHDGDGDGVADFELTNAEQVMHHVALGHIVIEDTGIYFECPMIPQRR